MRRGRVASPQIRNTGTIGGNVSQDARCWYYRYGLPCYRAGGNTCFADTPEGVNREHALFDADRCIAVSPSDTAPALVALDAKFVIRSTKGERVDRRGGVLHRAEGRHHAYDVGAAERDADRDPHPQRHGPARSFYFEKVADRETWDFALVNVAAAIVVDQRHDRSARASRAAGSAPCRGVDRGGRGDQGKVAGRGYRQARRPVGGARRAAGELQPVQDSVDGEPGHARGARRRRP